MKHVLPSLSTLTFLTLLLASSPADAQGGHFTKRNGALVPCVCPNAPRQVCQSKNWHADVYRIGGAVRLSFYGTSARDIDRQIQSAIEFERQWARFTNSAYDAGKYSNVSAPYCGGCMVSSAGGTDAAVQDLRQKLDDLVSRWSRALAQSYVRFARSAGPNQYRGTGAGLREYSRLLREAGQNVRDLGVRLEETSMHNLHELRDLLNTHQQTFDASAVSLRQTWAALPLSLREQLGETFRPPLDVTNLDPQTLPSAVSVTVLDAAKRGDADALEKAIGARSDVNAKDAPFGYTALMYAARTRNAAILLRLVKAGADVNAAGGDGYTALMFAANSGDVSIVRALLDAGASVNSRNAAGYTALQIVGSGDSQVTALLRQHGGR